MSEEQGSTPQEPAEDAQEPQLGVTVLRWTGDNLEAVKELLGDAFDKTRGGLQEDDPIVVWFWASPGASIEARKQVFGRAQPGDWIVRRETDETFVEFQAMSSDDFDRWKGTFTGE